MKHVTLTSIILLSVAAMMVTGFQCGSADMTSAKLYLQRSEWEKAEASLAKEVAKNPGNSEAWYLLGHSRMQKQNYAGMMEAFDNSLKGGKEFEKSISDAKKSVWGQSLNHGVNLYNSSITAPKDSAGIIRQQAMESYKTALLVNPDSAITYQYAATVYHVDGKYDEEIAMLREALKRKESVDYQTSIVNAYLQKGQAAEDRGNKAEASENFNNAIVAINDARKLDPANEELLPTMIDLYVRTNRSGEAKPFIYEALVKDPVNKVYQYNLGVLLTGTDSLKEAIPHFESALQADPKYDVALQNIAVAHMKLGEKMKKESQAGDGKKATDKSYVEQFKKAASYFERLTALKPDNADLWDALGSAYANANMLKQAQEALKKGDALRKK